MTNDTLGPWIKTAKQPPQQRQRVLFLVWIAGLKIWTTLIGEYDEATSKFRVGEHLLYPSPYWLTIPADAQRSAKIPNFPDDLEPKP